MTSPGFVPDSKVVGEEVVNRRGMHTRIRKKNSFYFDDENAVTTTTRTDDMRKSKPLTKKLGRKATKETVDDISVCKNGNLDSSPPFGPKEVRGQQIKSSSIRGRSSSKRNQMQSNTQVTVNKERESSVEKPCSFTIHENIDEPEASEPKRFFENSLPVETGSPIDTACRKPRKKSKKASRDVSTPRKVRSVGRPKRESISGRNNNEQHGESAGGLQKSKTCQYEDSGWKKELGLGFNNSPVINIKSEQKTTSRFCTDFETGGAVSDQELQKCNEMMDYEGKKAVKAQKKRKHLDKKVNNQERSRGHKESIPVVSALPPVSVTPYGLTSTPSAQDSELLRAFSTNRRVAHDIGMRLRNVLKLPKAHKWVCFEWFYSSVDRVLLEGPNDFETCLPDLFPYLKTRMLTRVQWCKIRKYMGKPRRCSQKFFNEERIELAVRRQKVRMIQQRKAIDFDHKDLPNLIPLQLVVGTKVTVRLYRPLDGLFTGTIEGVDTSNNTYRIAFDREGLGTHSIPDYEVLSNNPVETMPTTSFAWKIGYISCNKRKNFENSTLKHLKSFPNVVPNSSFPFEGRLGGFSVRILELIILLSKILKIKRGKICELKELNVEAEVLQSYSMTVSQNFRLKYSRCVIDLECINKDLMIYMHGILNYLPDIGSNSSIPTIIPEDVQMLCKEEANAIVSSHNILHYGKSVQNPQSLTFISSLASLMLQVKMLSVADRNPNEVKCIKDTVAKIKPSLAGNNVQAFQERIEIPINRILAGLCIRRPPKT